jgi:hypothetical protein
MKVFSLKNRERGFFDFVSDARNLGVSEHSLRGLHVVLHDILKLCKAISINFVEKYEFRGCN